MKELLRSVSQGLTFILGSDGKFGFVEEVTECIGCHCRLRRQIIILGIPTPMSEPVQD